MKNQARKKLMGAPEGRLKPSIYRRRDSLIVKSLHQLDSAIRTWRPNCGRGGAWPGPKRRTEEENDLLVADYFPMLGDELSGRPYVKARHIILGLGNQL
jgi:hypothetical protein